MGERGSKITKRSQFRFDRFMCLPLITASRGSRPKNWTDSALNVARVLDPERSAASKSTTLSMKGAREQIPSVTSDGDEQ